MSLLKNDFRQLDEQIVVLSVEAPSDYDNKNTSKYQINPYDHHPSEAANILLCRRTDMIN